MIVTGDCISTFENSPVTWMNKKVLDPWPIDLEDMVSFNLILNLSLFYIAIQEYELLHYLMGIINDLNGQEVIQISPYVDRVLWPEVHRQEYNTLLKSMLSFCIGNLYSD